MWKGGAALPRRGKGRCEGVGETLLACGKGALFWPRAGLAALFGRQWANSFHIQEIPGRRAGDGRMRRERLFANRAIALSGGATADSARTRLRAIGP